MYSPPELPQILCESLIFWNLWKLKNQKQKINKEESIGEYVWEEEIDKRKGRWWKKGQKEWEKYGMKQKKKRNID